MQEPVRRRRSLLTRPAARFRLALGIWGALGLLACILYARRYSAVELTLPQLLMAIMLSGFAGMLGYFAWLMYVPSGG